MSIADQFGMSKRRKQNGDPPMLPAVRSPSLEDLSEDARRYFLKVEDQRLANEAMTSEIERKDKVIMRLEAEADVRNVALTAVTAERDQLLHRVNELDTEMCVIATLIVNWGDKVRASMKKKPTHDETALLDAMAAAVEEPK